MSSRPHIWHLGNHHFRVLANHQNWHHQPLWGCHKEPSVHVGWCRSNESALVLPAVVMKSSAQQEAASVTTWPRVSRASTFTVSRFGRVPFPRGILSPYRSRYPIKTGARSLQWKRDAQNPSSETIQSPTSIPSPTTRSLIYVRTENKIDGYSNAA